MAVSLKRKCTWCGEYKDDSEFNTYKGKYKSRCKQCEKIYHQTYVRSHKETEPKVCTRCGKLKPIDEFRYMVMTNRYHSWCKHCEKTYIREYQKKKKNMVMVDEVSKLRKR